VPGAARLRFAPPLLPARLGPAAAADCPSLGAPATNTRRQHSELAQTWLPKYDRFGMNRSRFYGLISGCGTWGRSLVNELYQFIIP
jgi:hypothetical protein